MITPAAKNVFQALQAAAVATEDMDLVVAISDFTQPISVSYTDAPKAYLDELAEVFKDRPDVQLNLLYKSGLDVQLAPGVRLFISMAEAPRLIEVLTAAMGDVFLSTLTAKAKARAMAEILKAEEKLASDLTADAPACVRAAREAIALSRPIE